MVDPEGGRWDVGVKDNTVHLVRVSDSDERLLVDQLAPEEARHLAELLRKYADKVDGSAVDDDGEDDDSDDDSDDSDDDDSRDAEQDRGSSD